RLLLNHKEPAVGIVRWFAECFRVSQVEAKKRHVRFQRATKEWVTFVFFLAREIELRSWSWLNRLHRIDHRVRITTQQFTANEQHEFAVRARRVLPEVTAIPFRDYIDVRLRVANGR